MAITTAHLIERIAAEEKVPKSVVKRILERSFKEIEKILKDGSDVQLRNFGLFYNATLEAKTYFGGSRSSERRKVIRFKQSRRPTWKSTQSSKT